MTIDSRPISNADQPTADDARLVRARVLTEMGELDTAESEALALLEERSEHYGALSLLARIKHIKGELTQAFTLWAQLRALQPEAGNAQARLAAILQLAQDPERGAGEFLAVGQSHLWRKPARMLELEQVFQLFVRRQPDEARLAALRLARKYQGSDGDLFKLARLAEAWLAELSGDLEGARDILEKLGLERGFEHDLDRALALARVYELLGSPLDLEKAVHVCQFLARSFQSFEGVVALGRLAALHRALGQEEPAELSEQA
ncbi:MAG: tetratricopeptide repeat protein, partial [Myxococcota bacterium]